MIKRGQVLVRGKKVDGSWGSVDVLDLTDESFRAWIVDRLWKAGLVVALKDEMVEGEPIVYQEGERSGRDEGVAA